MIMLGRLLKVFRHPPPTTSADSPIVTFDEWTKEKLKQDARAQQLAPGAAATRNYASKECGAKVLLSNPEAENTKAILNEKEKDEYMRNPCEKAENKFVIIELCETVQPHSIELANYELFSSGPKTIRLWSAERFPNGEWKLLSELTAADSRQSQQFHIPTNGAYVELISHYGNEHYCTLSVLKILGISMVDEYEAEVRTEAASVAHTRNNVESSETKTNVTSTEGTDNVSTVTFTPASSAASQLAQTQVCTRLFVDHASLFLLTLVLDMKRIIENCSHTWFMKTSQNRDEYLSELSRQYVAQSDEHQKHMKQARKVVEQAVETIYARVNETLASKVSSNSFSLSPECDYSVIVLSQFSGLSASFVWTGGFLVQGA
ncbi:unnamed protein product [Heligmosomoides polygyrus]|uniref:SUN domain-containing protein n=1 Tax=Heligmosomoides polygyrus TaxID=6339 RepID=A0A183FNC9_HELPZ|nr:unnamed protein product [Heligmosomoides polygyrus]